MWPQNQSKQWADILDHKSQHVEEAVRELIDIFSTIFVSKDTKAPTPTNISGTGPINYSWYSADIQMFSLYSNKKEVVGLHNSVFTLPQNKNASITAW